MTLKSAMCERTLSGDMEESPKLDMKWNSARTSPLRRRGKSGRNLPNSELQAFQSLLKQSLDLLACQLAFDDEVLQRLNIFATDRDLAV